ncbi:hypothetical protein M405DRAFT_845373 [Rhizopogon salebrosus TDB-379]|nr:hypothetical protein M405DRAFT_845373 [Rhizopogon salebrosus TDB-379]
MSKTSRSKSSTPQNSLSPSSRVSCDTGTLELGIESTWTRDDTFATGVEWSDSQRAEPPTSGLLSAIDAEGALGAPEDSSPPLVSIDGNDLKIKRILLVDDQDYGSEPMSLSPLLGSIAGLRPHDMSSPVTRQFENNTRVLDDVSWADMPVNGDIGDIPEFPPASRPSSAPSTLRIPSELKGKSVDPIERGNAIANKTPKDWLNQWTKTDNGLAERSRPKSTDPDASLIGLWDDENFCELENLIIQSLMHKKEAHKLVWEVYSEQRISQQKPQDQSIKTPLKTPIPTAIQTPVTQASQNGAPLARHQHTSSVLPTSSSVKHAMMGNNEPTPKPVNTVDPSDENPEPSGAIWAPRHVRITRPESHESDAYSETEETPNDFRADFLSMEPESDHASDLAETKRENGDANATTFKKWVREKGYSLTEFFEQLFDYIFPPDFHMQQRPKKFLKCRQDGKQSATGPKPVFGFPRYQKTATRLVKTAFFGCGQSLDRLQPGPVATSSQPVRTAQDLSNGEQTVFLSVAK